MSAIRLDRWKRAWFEVLGVPLAIDHVDPTIAALAEELFVRPEGSDLAPLALRVGWCAVDRPLPPRVRFGQEGARFTIEGPFGEGLANQESAEGEILFHPSATRDMRISALETLALFLAWSRRPIALHAAAMELEGRCCLVSGPEGAGKSTIAYACLKSGMRLIADDVVYVSPSEPRFVWGLPTSLYLTTCAPELFPELHSSERVNRLNGEMKLRVAVRERFPGAALQGHAVDGIALLDIRRGAEPRWMGAEVNEVIESLTGFRKGPAFDQPKMAETARHLAGLPAARLAPGKSPESSARALSSWLLTLDAHR